MNRSSAPPFELSPRFSFLKAKTSQLKNGVFIHSIDAGDSKMLKLELRFNAGSKYHTNNLVATACSELLFEGTEQYNAKEIAQIFENQGAYLSSSSQQDYAYITLYFLEDTAEKLLPILFKIIQTANFPEEELTKFKQIQLQKLRLNQEKVSFLARNAFSDAIFPKPHPYNLSRVEADYFNLTKTEIEDFYKKHYKNKTYEIFLAGNLNQNMLNKVELIFGTDSFEDVDSKIINSYASDNIIYQEINKENALQTAIRVGQLTLPRNHSDFQALFFVNTILGAYFGSRLMTNIREDKGYTYGIGSGIQVLNELSYFFISTEVGSEHANATMTEIEKELNRLKQEPVDADELQLVKNYIIGSLMRNFDGPYEALDRYKHLRAVGLSYDYYEQLFDTIATINQERIMEISNKYLNFESMHKILAGNFN